MTQDWSDKTKMYNIENKIVHCRTHSEATHLFDIAEGQGYKWASGEKLRDNNWNVYRAETCYHFMDDKTVMYGTIGTYEEIYPHQNIYKYDEIVR